MSRKSAIGCGMVLAMALLATPALAAEDYEINVVLPLTGGGSFLGKAEQQGLQLAEGYVNGEGGIQGRKLKFIFHDDQSQPQTAVQLASQIVASHPAVVIGSAVVGMCNAMAPLMREGPVMYCLSPGIHPEKGDYVFTSNVSTVDLASALITFYRLKGWTKLALITSTDASGQDAERGIKDVLARPDNKGVTLVANEHFTPTDVSVSAQIEKISAAQPQALIAWSTGGPIGTVFKGIIQAGLDLPVGTTNGNMTLAQMTQYADFLPKQLFIPSSEWPKHDARLTLDPAVEKAQAGFFATYEAAKVTPDVAAVLAWDPALLVVDAIRKLGPAATAVQVRDDLAKLQGFPGINGVYDFPRIPQRGLDERDAVVTLWDPGQKTWKVVSKPTGIPLEQ
ncbi:MAG: receptor ligand binding region family protein [Rhodospirillales bacterium]|nr:receptor ligand binding region family protein [Rhodospirillales bacterium]